jgi:hypothetical protein
MVAYVCHLSYAGNVNGRISVQASLGIKGDLISKITHAKKG